MRHIPGAWRRAAAGAGLLGEDGSPAPTIFAEMSALAARTGAINLGQGFPDEDGPAEVLDAARAAIRGGVNQYPPGRGMPVLRAAIAEHQRHWYGLDLDPDREVLVTVGATEALAAALLALAGPGDDVVVFEPYYDSYAACVALAGARLVPVPLAWPSFAPDLDVLRGAVTDRTRVILVNDPHNPTGAVLGDEARGEIVRLAERHDAVILTDEVYEHLVWAKPHVPLATLPGAAERTLTISSAAKTFAVTGWKIGWISGPGDLVDAVLAVKQFLTYVGGAPFQPAVAVGLGLPDAFFDGVAGDMREKAALLGDGLTRAGFAVSPPSGTYFTVADAGTLRAPEAADAGTLRAPEAADAGPLGGADGLRFCRELPARAGVVAIPLTSFVSPGLQHRYRSLVRFAACKRVEVLQEAVARLAALAG